MKGRGRWLLPLALSASVFGCRRDEPAPASIIPSGVMVAHALGGVGGYVYTNSLEAFQCNYARGFRWFEVDLALTADGQLVCFHTGNEAALGLTKPLQQLTLAETERLRYAGRYPIRSFIDLLAEAERAGDVVLVTDTKTWAKPMLEAFERTVRSSGVRRTRFALQSYGEQDIAAVKATGEALHADLLLTLYMSGADDQRVEQLVQEYGVKAVVADMRRFTPWLAQRLHALGVPVLVHTVNDHRDIARLARAGADGFYTDDYRPYVPGAAGTLADCTFSGDEAGSDLTDWVERDLLRFGDYGLASCARRGPNRVELSACGREPAIWGPSLAVPAGRTVHVELDLEADADGSDVWFELGEKNRAAPLRPRESLKLGAGERRAQAYDLALPSGSPGIEVRLGLASAGDGLSIHRLNVSHRVQASQVSASTASSPRAAQ